MGSIYQRGSKWWVKYRDERGRLIRKSAGDTRLEALRMLREQEGKSEGIPLDSILDTYLSSLETRAKSRSVQGARSSVGKLLESLGPIDTQSFTEPDLDRFIRARQAQGVKPKTINGDLIVLRAALNHAVRVGLLASMPLRVRLLKAPRKRVVPILERDEIRRLLDKAHEPYRGILLVCAHTGFRLSEVLNLTWGDVLWREGKLAVTAKNGWSAKSHQERAVYVDDAVLEYLRERRESSRFSKSKDYVFSTRSANPVSSHNACREIQKVFKRADLYQEGVPLSHRLRHTVASRLLGEGVDVETVRCILGHADGSTTLLYAQTTDARMREASTKLRL